MSAFERLETHLFTYNHDGGQWVLEIQAKDADDARARIGKLAYASYDGVMIAKIPAVTGPIAPFLCFIQRMLRPLFQYNNR